MSEKDFLHISRWQVLSNEAGCVTWHQLTKRSGRSWKADQLFRHVAFVKEMWILWKTCYREMDLVHRGLYHAKMKAAHPKALIQPPSREICDNLITLGCHRILVFLFLESKKLVICTCIYQIGWLKGVCEFWLFFSLKSYAFFFSRAVLFFCPFSNFILL